jgi:hypothetical protein
MSLYYVFVETTKIYLSYWSLLFSIVFTLPTISIPYFDQVFVFVPIKNMKTKTI